MTGDDPLGRLIDAIASGDAEAAREIYAPDATIWHNTERREQSVDENVRTLRWVQRNVADLRYTDVRRQRTERGYVQQHVLRGTAPGGEPLEIHACIVVEVEDGRITRLFEYIDSDQITALRNPRPDAARPAADGRAAR
jgi:ketosteroid isomerase-like protein